MDKNFKFLTEINGIYNLGEESLNLNYFDNILIFFNEDAEIFKIRYKRLNYINNNININKGEIILNDIGETEYEFILNNINENLIKNLLFNKYLDYMGDHLNYEKIY